MSKIITVWGNPGSGKSTFCCALARELTQHRERALILSADSLTPMYPVWLPGTAVDAKKSIGHLFASTELNKAAVSSRLVVPEKYPFIGLLGYAAGETPLAYPEPTAELTESLLREAAKLADTLIVDGGSQIAGYFTPTAMECSDVIIRILTPDPRGIAYLKAQAPLLRDPRFGLEKNLTFAGMARPYHALDEMGALSGGLAGILPYSKEVEQAVIAGEMFEAARHANQRYVTALERVLKEVADDWPE